MSKDIFINWENTINRTSKLKNKTRNYCAKNVILTFTEIHKILSEKHALMLIMQQTQIIKIRNIRCKSF